MFYDIQIYILISTILIPYNITLMISYSGNKKINAFPEVEYSTEPNFNLLPWQMSPWWSNPLMYLLHLSHRSRLEKLCLTKRCRAMSPASLQGAFSDPIRRQGSSTQTKIVFWRLSSSSPVPWKCWFTISTLCLKPGF